MLNVLSTSHTLDRSLGVMLFGMLTGSVPFPSRGQMDPSFIARVCSAYYVRETRRFNRWCGSGAVIILRLSMHFFLSIA